MLEVRLDHDTGTMSGTVLSGRYAGQGLAALSRPDLIGLRLDLARDDPEGVPLLETYLDRRFSGWREADEGEAQAGRAAGGGVEPASPEAASGRCRDARGRREKWRGGLAPRRRLRRKREGEGV